jgi:transposase
MAQSSILPAHLQLLGLTTDTRAITAHVSTTAGRACCPQCQHPSIRIHSRYMRHVADLPWQGVAVCLRLRTRRFFCDNPACHRVIFAERLPDVVAPYAHKTVRLAHVLELIGVLVGGEAGARLVAALGIGTSPDALLRLVRRVAVPAGPPARIIGVDDFAFRRGMHYGTIILDLERHHVLDLLPDRTAATFADWLIRHPSVQVISRDRGTSYAEGGRVGAPQALQIADRFHLLERWDRVLLREQQTLLTVAQHLQHRPEYREMEVSERRPPRAQRETEIRRERRRARYEAVIQAHGQGVSIRQIVRQQGLARGTVRRYLRAGVQPEPAIRRQRPRTIDPFVPYVRERWNAGEDNSGVLFRAIQARGYTGSATMVRTYLADWRSGPRRPGRRIRGAPIGEAPPPLQTWTVRQTRWLLVDAVPDPSPQDEQYRQAVLAASPVIQLRQALVMAFFQLVRHRDRDALDAWLMSAEQSAIPEMVSFVQGVRRDYAAVAAAVSQPWSQGQTEGAVNRLKFIKRSGYGRMRFDLLRQRVLARGLPEYGPR